MNKQFFSLVVLFVFSVRLFAQAGDLSLIVKEEASLKALSFLSLIPEGREKEYGFNSRSDFSKIRVEVPYETYYVSSSNGKLTLIPGNEWRVPVSVNGQYVTLLTVQMYGGKAEAVDLGGNFLAQKIQEFEKQHPDMANRHVLIRNTFLKQDYISSDFSSIYSQNEDTGIFEMNASPTLLIYQLNEGQPIATNMAFFYEQTLDVLRNTNDTK